MIAILANTDITGNLDYCTWKAVLLQNSVRGALEGSIQKISQG